jgi:hypothetical protein
MFFIRKDGVLANWVPESQAPKQNLVRRIFFAKRSKLPCLKAYISETIELNKKRLKNLLTNFLCPFQIRKDPTSDIGTLTIRQRSRVVYERIVNEEKLS